MPRSSFQNNPNSPFGSFAELFLPPTPLEPPSVLTCLLPICEALRKDAEKFKSFSKVKWDCVENRCSPMMRPLCAVIEEALCIQLSHVDISDVLRVYTNKRGRFQHKHFLRDVIGSVLQISKYEEAMRAVNGADAAEDQMKQTEKEEGNSTAKTKLQQEHAKVVAVEPTTLPPVKVHRLVSKFGIYNNISCHGGLVGVVKEARGAPLGRSLRSASMSAVNRDILVGKLIAAKNLQYPLRLELNAQSFRMIPDMSEKDFTKEMKRVLDLNLTKQEAHTLFELFDFEGEGTITESQLHEGLAKLHIAKIRERKKKDREAQIDLFQDDTSAASRRSQHATGSSIDKSTSTASVASGNSKTSFVDSHYSFQPSDFQSAIHKFYRRYEKHTDVRLNPPLLRIPDGYLNRKFVRRALKEQLNIKLTVQETDALCHKLSYGTTDDRIGFTSDEMENPKLMFIGKSVKALVVRIANVVVNKLPNLHKQQMESSILVDTVTGSSAAEDYLVAEEKAIFTLI